MTHLTAFDRAFDRLFGIEGGHANDPADSGGETMYGITVAVARANGYTGPMDEMPLDVARTIARRQYWDTLRLDDIACLSPAVAVELFDTGYNCGIAVAGRFLQRALNVFNLRQADYPDINRDGLIGPMTLFALKRFLDKHRADGERVLLRCLNSEQGEFYLSLAEMREKDERFVFGWFLNRVEIPT